VEDDDFGVPAGWYPDPLGLPQLRWWDGEAWTGFTSEAQAPDLTEVVTTVPEPEPRLESGSADEPARGSEPEPVLGVEPETPAPLVPEPEAVFVGAGEGMDPHSIARLIGGVPLEDAPLAPGGTGQLFLTRRERRDHERRLETGALSLPLIPEQDMLP